MLLKDQESDLRKSEVSNTPYMAMIRLMGNWKWSWRLMGNFIQKIHCSLFLLRISQEGFNLQHFMERILQEFSKRKLSWVFFFFPLKLFLINHFNQWPHRSLNWTWRVLLLKSHTKMHLVGDGMSGFSQVDMDFHFLNILQSSKLSWGSYLLRLTPIDRYV